MIFEIPSTLFDSHKAVQVVAVMLRAQPSGQTGRRRLLKLLYLAERTALKEGGQMITWDRVFAMEFGPVLSEVYDLIKQTHEDSVAWDRYVRCFPIEVKLVKDPGVDLLSKFEIEILQRIAKNFEAFDDQALVDYCHKNCPEWKDPGSTSVPIPLSAILKAIGMKDAEVTEVISEARKAGRVRAHFERMEPSQT